MGIFGWALSGLATGIFNKRGFGGVLDLEVKGLRAGFFKYFAISKVITTTGMLKKIKKSRVFITKIKINPMLKTKLFRKSLV